MNLPTYTSTPGLEGYPRHERFTVYRATHRRLMRDDAAYRRRWMSYVVGIVCVATLPMAGLLAGGGAATLLFLLSLGGSLVGIGYLAFRQQQFMNRRIGDALGRSAP